MSLPPSHFADTFRVLIVPKLRDLAKVQAVLVALDCATLSEAEHKIYQFARKHGAGYLPPEHHDILEDWISTALLEMVVAAEERFEVQRAEMAHVHADIELWNARVLEAMNGGI